MQVLLFSLILSAPSPSLPSFYLPLPSPSFSLPLPSSLHPSLPPSPPPSPPLLLLSLPSLHPLSPPSSSLELQMQELVMKIMDGQGLPWPKPAYLKRLAYQERSRVCVLRILEEKLGIREPSDTALASSDQIIAVVSDSGSYVCMYVWSNVLGQPAYVFVSGSPSDVFKEEGTINFLNQVSKINLLYLTTKKLGLMK